MAVRGAGRSDGPDTLKHRGNTRNRSDAAQKHKGKPQESGAKQGDGALKTQVKRTEAGEAGCKNKGETHGGLRGNAEKHAENKGETCENRQKTAGITTKTQAFCTEIAG